MPGHTHYGILIAALLGVTVSLLLVGLVSGTIVRHMIQVLPVVLALVAVARRQSWARDAALAVLLFWLFIMTLIWLYLLELASIVSGTFTLPEIILTCCIGACALGGITVSVKPVSRSSWGHSATAFAVTMALQIAAMWISLQRPITSI